MAAKKAKKQKRDDRKVRITYNPKFSASTQKTVLLRKEVKKLVNDTIQSEFVPQIEGLPMKFTIEKGEIKEVTMDQLKALYNLGEFEFPQQFRERERKIQEVSNQAGVRPEDYKLSASISHLYNEVFTLAE